ncbi:MAG: hypothetical protein PHI98_03275 [Eubacteriales bacterium]|nr:hypothetical protein [Eubacteriales bacterium]
MIRKVFTTLLCLLLALALPLSAMAATEVSFSVTLGDALGAEAGLKDLFDALSLRLLKGESSGLLGLSMEKEELLTLAVKADGEGVYVESAALGAKPLYFSKEELTDFAVSAAKQNADMDEENIAVIRQSIDQAFAYFDLMSKGEQATASASEAVDETVSNEKLNEMLQAFSEDKALQSYITGIIDKVQVTDGDYTAENRDPATQKIDLTVTSEDLIKLADSTMVQGFLISASKEDGKTLTNEEAAAKLKTMLEALDYNAPITVYTADEGNTIVGMEVTATMKGTINTTDEDGKADTEDIDFTMDMEYTRLSGDAGIQHGLSFSAKDEDEEKMKGNAAVVGDGKGGYTLTGEMTVIDDDKPETLQMRGALNTADKAVDGWLGLVADKSQITFGFTGKTEENSAAFDLSIYTRDDAASVIELSASDRPIITFHVIADGNADEAVLSAVNEATLESSTQLLKLSGEEQTKALQELQTSAMQVLYTLMGKLPASTLQMLTSSGTTTK